MKQKNFLTILIVSLSIVAGKALAYDAKINGIFYNFNGDEATVTKEKSLGTYTGNVIIPEAVTYEGKTYKVTSIGENAFYACSNDLTSVVIPNSVISIGNSAFYECKGLTNVSVPNSVKSIGQGAFMMCRNLTTVSLGNSIESVGEDCFAYCDNLTSINIPPSLTIIPKSFITGAKIKSIVIPEGVTTIGQTSFACHLESITIPSTVTSIDKYPFGLGTDINTPDTLKVYINNLEAWLKIFAKYYEESGRWDILHPFYSRVTGGKCNILYLNGEVLQDVVIPASMTTIPPYAFYGCQGIKTVTMHNAVTEIAAGAFSNCRNLESVVISNSVTKIGMNAFLQDTIQSLVIGSGVLEIAKDAFTYSYLLTSNVSNIKKAIWLTNTPPKNYENAAGVINYVSNSLYKFSNPYSATYVYPLLSSTFAIDGVKYVPISMSERTCDAFDAVYDGSSELTKLGTSVTYRGVTFKVSNVNPYTCCGNTFVKKAELGEGLPYIDDHVFDGCTNLGSAKLPETITRLGISSFQKCVSLKEITLPVATTNVMYNAFKGCQSLQNVTMDDGVEQLTLAYNADKLKIKYQTNLVEIDGDGLPLFEDCPLNKVYIGRNIFYGTSEREGYSPFYRNTSLREVEITDQETEIGENEFYGCTGLKIVKIGDGVTTFGNWAFSGCSSLDYFSFGSSVAAIGQEAFSDCTSITRLIGRAATPPACGSQALDDVNKWGCSLEVPEGMAQAYQAADQWKEFLFVEEGEAVAVWHKVIYVVDGEAYKTVDVATGKHIVAEEAPVKEGYVFSGWSGLPEVMPDADVTVSGTFTKAGDGTGLKGDLNGDGRVDMADVTLLINIILGR